jgi:hypothetical protein
MPNGPLPTSPRAPADRVQDFVSSFRSTEFAHSAEVFGIMTRNDESEAHIAVFDGKLDASLRSIYRVRASGLASRPPSPTHPHSLTTDVKAVADRFEAAADQAMRTWYLTLPKGTVYVVFELINDHAIAGSIKSADQRVVPLRPELVQFGDLTPAHFATHPVWVACHVVDYDEPWYDETDEETFRPWRGGLPVKPEIGILLVRTHFVTSSGRQLDGFISPAGASEVSVVRATQPHIFLSSGRMLGFWLGMVLKADDQLARLQAELSQLPSEIFPIEFSAEPGLATGVQSGTIVGFANMDNVR